MEVIELQFFYQKFCRVFFALSINELENIKHAIFILIVSIFGVLSLRKFNIQLSYLLIFFSDDFFQTNR